MRATSLVGSLAIMLLFGASAAQAQLKSAGGTAANPALVIGDSYVVRAERGGVKKSFRGDLVKANDRWIVLHYVGESRGEQAASWLAKVPLPGHKNRSTPIGHTDQLLWIPREAATIEKQIPSANRASAPARIGETPPVKVACYVDLVAGGKAAHRQGGLEAYKDDRLTISVPGKVRVETPDSPVGIMAATTSVKKYEARYKREQFARRDILCVRVANYEPVHAHD